jgi:hypothetical protein
METERENLRTSDCEWVGVCHLRPMIYKYYNGTQEHEKKAQMTIYIVVWAFYYVLMFF